MSSGVAANSRLSPVTNFDNFLRCEDVLLIKQHLERTLDFIQCKLSLMECGENGNQYIGIMLYVIQIEVVLIVPDSV